MLRPLQYILVLVIPFVLVGFKADNQKVDWNSWNEGYQKGLKTDKAILVDVYTDWCGWCKKMDKTTYSNGEVINKIDKHFVPIKFNPEEDKTYTIDGREVNGPELLKIISNGKHNGYPSTYFLFPEIRKIQGISGYKGPKAFKKTLDKMIAFKKQQNAN